MGHSRNTQIEALEPCPFCGCTDVSNNDDGDHQWYECDWCHATSGFDPEPEFEGLHPSFHWNRRAIRGAAAPSEEPVVEEAAKRMVDAWCRAPRGTPDWNAEWARKRSQYLKQASAVLSTTPATFFDRIEARLDAARELAKSIAIYTVEDDAGIRLSTGGHVVAHYGEHSREGIALLKLEACVQALLAALAQDTDATPPSDTEEKAL